MKKANEKNELLCAVFICSLISSLLIIFIKSVLWVLILSAVFCTLLFWLYLDYIKPFIENLTAGSVYEYTQADCYKTEDESEEVSQ